MSIPRFLVFASLLFLIAGSALAADAPKAVEPPQELVALGAGSYPYGFAELGGYAYFFATTNDEGQELWRTDGTSAGTTMVKAIRPDVISGHEGSTKPVVFNGAVYFSASDNGVAQLWMSDGTEAGTVKVKELPAGSNIQQLERAGNLLFLVVADTGGYYTSISIWRSDGTAAGTSAVKSFNANSIGYSVALGDMWLFTLGADVWRTDGTEAGTIELGFDAESVAPVATSTHAYFVGSNYYSATGLWRTNGTTSEHVETITSIAKLAVLSGRVYFASNGSKLWSTTGDASAASLVHDFAPDYTRSGYTCQSICGTITGLYPASDRMYVFAGTAYYNASGSGGSAAGTFGLWKTNGTSAGTESLAVIPSDTGYTPGTTGLTIGTRLYTTAGLYSTGSELWTSDGTAAGTLMVKDIDPDVYAGTGNGYSSSPAAFGVLGSKLLFRGTDRFHGAEPWISDGTEAGTTLVRNINPEGIIKGRVYDAATNDPVPSAIVTIYAKNSSGVAEAIRSFAVDAGGNYQIDGLPTLTYYLLVTNTAGYVAQNWNGRDCFPCSSVGEGVFVVSPETVSNIDFPLHKGGVISGHVSKASDGTPVSGLKVTVAKQYGVTGTFVLTDANGDYATKTGLPDGTYAVYTDATTYSGQIWNNISCAAGCTTTTAFTGVTVSGASTITGIDFSVQPLGIITGRLTDSVTGEPIGDVLVGAFSRDREMTASYGELYPTAWAYTKSDGTYTISLRDGTYSLLFRRDAYNSKFWPNTTCSTCTTHAGTAIVPVPGSTSTYDAVLQPKGGRIRGSVKETGTNAPIKGLTVYLYNGAGQQLYNASTSADGSFAFPPFLPPTTYYLRTDPSVWYDTVYIPEIWDGVNGTPCNTCSVTTGAKLVITGTTVIDNVNLTLDKFGTLHAKVYDATTLQPVDGHIVLTNADGTPVRDVWNESDYTFTQVWPGTYYMHLGYVNGYPTVYYGGTAWCATCPDVGGTPITVSPNVETAVNFPLKPWGHITGRVTDTSGQGIPYAQVQVYVRDETYPTGSATADFNGDYSVSAYGDVIVKASAQGHTTRAHNGAECPNCYDVPPLTVDGGATVTVNFVLPASAHITGTVVDGVGLVTGQIFIAIYDSHGNIFNNGYTDYSAYSWNGTFDILVGAGTYYLHTLPQMSSGNGTGYLGTTYKAQTCNTFCKDKALAITVASGGTVNLTVPLNSIAKITGKVTNVNTGAAIANVPLVVWDLIGNKAALNVSSGSDGTYSAMVPVGRYAVYTNSTSYTNQVWNGVTCGGTCTPSAGTSILARNVYPAVDFALTPKPVAPRDAYGDFNADGRSEIIWRSGTGVFTMWSMNGRTIANSQSITTLTDANWKVLGFGDFDGDSDDDFFFRNSVNGGTAMWLMDGKNITLNAPSTAVADMKWQMQAIGDFHGDGKDELIWRHTTTGQVAMWEMQGTKLLNGAVFYTVSDLNWEIVLAADFTGDKKDELLWRNKKTGALAMWEMNGRTLTNGATFATVSDLTWTIIATGDYNGDGKADLLWRNSVSNQTAMWEMNGRTVTDGRSLITVGSAWAIERCGDFNGDKKDEILWRNTATGQIAMWETNGHTLLNTAIFATVSDLNTKMQPRGGVRPALDSQ